MLHFSRWKVLAILAVVLAGVVFALPNVLPKQWQDTLRENIGLKPMTRGLDLQGGSSILAELDGKELLDTLIVRQMGDVRAALREARILYKLNRMTDGISVQITEAADSDRAGELLKGMLANAEAGQVFVLGRADRQFTLVFSENGIETRMNQAVEQTLKILDYRLNGLGISDASVQRQGKDRIHIQLPGVDDPDQTIKKIGQMAKLTFHLACESQPVAATDNPPPNCVSYPMRSPPQRAIWIKAQSADIVDGDNINNATAIFDSATNEPLISFHFNQKGALQFGKITTDNVGEMFAIVLDRQIISAPRIVEPILGGSGQISGNFTVEETNDLAVVLRSGALPARLVYIDAVGESTNDAQAKRSDP